MFLCLRGKVAFGEVDLYDTLQGKIMMNNSEKW